MRSGMAVLAIVTALLSAPAGASAEEAATDSVVLEEQAIDSKALGEAVSQAPAGAATFPTPADPALGSGPAAFDQPAPPPTEIGVSTGAAAITNLEGSFGGATIRME